MAIAKVELVGKALFDQSYMQMRSMGQLKVLVEFMRGMTEQISCFITSPTQKMPNLSSYLKDSLSLSPHCGER